MEKNKIVILMLEWHCKWYFGVAFSTRGKAWKAWKEIQETYPEEYTNYRIFTTDIDEIY